MNESVWYGAAPEAAPAETAPEGEFHAKMRVGCRYFLGLSAALGGVFAACFVESGGLGLNLALWSAAWCAWAHLGLKKLDLAVLRRDGRWYVGIILLGLSVFWTANEFIQAVSILGIMILQCLWVLNVFARVGDWHFGKAAAAVLMLPLRALARITEPFQHLIRERKNRSGRGRYVLAGLAIAVPLGIIVTVLLASADAVFRELTRPLAQWDAPRFLQVIFESLAAAVAVGAAFYALLCAQTDKPENDAQRAVRKADTLVAVTFTGVLAVIYVVFCGIQIAVLFSGRGALLPQGYTYAEYAREGFFQLLAVSGINVLLVIVSQRRFVSSKVLRALLCVISACTYIMEVSSAWRMRLYVQAYGLTFPRLLVLWFLTVLGVILAGAVVTVYRPGFRLFRFSLTVCLCAWLVFAFARPDALAARYDLRRFGCTDSTLSAIRYELSPDAIEELSPYLEGNAQDIAKYMDGYLDKGIPADYEAHGVRGFNYSRWRANLTAEEYINGR